MRQKVNLAQDIQILYHMARGGRGGTHAERLESFYKGQAETYDGFRGRLLHGRESLFQSLPVPKNGIWIDMGGGTGANLEALGPGLHTLGQVYLVDLCPSMLEIAHRRITQNGWSNVTPVEADVTTFQPRDRPVQAVTFSYSLTMMPDWQKALAHARGLLCPGGHIGVVDFYISPSRWSLPLPCHSWGHRQFWPRWFARDGVMINPQHPRTLTNLFETLLLTGKTGKIPYMPYFRVPYYQFIGRK